MFESGHPSLFRTNNTLSFKYVSINNLFPHKWAYVCLNCLEASDPSPNSSMTVPPAPVGSRDDSLINPLGLELLNGLLRQ